MPSLRSRFDVKEKQMEYIVNGGLAVLAAAWEVLLESSIFILFGFFVAGLLKGFIPDNFIQRHLGRQSKSGVFKASLFGVPIPLCSCGVIPAAAGLRDQGASKGAVTSFMISTPETGVDSVAVTYGLLDPVMTIIRPTAAFLTAFVSGLLVNFMDKKVPAPKENPLPGAGTLPKGKSSCSEEGCGCASNTGQGTMVSVPSGVVAKIKKGMSFSFGELLKDIGPWLIAGIILAGVITVMVSPRFITDYLGDGILAMAAMIALATPLYVCATASTPIAAALALKGLSPGAALVFLLAGPATNVATITVVSKLLGKKTAAIYVGSIMICSMVLGLVVNWLYALLGLDITDWVSSAAHGDHGVIYTASAGLLLLLIARPWVMGMARGKGPSPGTASGRRQGSCGCGQ